MSNTVTLTQSQTFSITEARYVSAKIAADLQILKSYYAIPSDDKITDYAEEAAILLSKRYLNSVEYGFKKNDKVIFSVQYVAKSDGTLITDNRPGKIPSSLNLEGSTFYSFLCKNISFGALSTAEQAAVEKLLPIARTEGKEPSFSNEGSWDITQTYSKNGEGVQRKVFKPWSS